MFKSKYILRRFGEADRNGYRSYTDRVIRLNVQSLNEKEREALPEGQRSSRRVKSFGRAEVHTVNPRAYRKPTHRHPGRPALLLRGVVRV